MASSGSRIVAEYHFPLALFWCEPFVVSPEWILTKTIFMLFYAMLQHHFL